MLSLIVSQPGYILDTKYIQHAVYTTSLHLGRFQLLRRLKKKTRHTKNTDLGSAASQRLLLKTNYNNTVETVSDPVFTSLVYE